MKRLLLVAPLVPGAREEAERLLGAGPPFDPEETHFARHAVYITDEEVVFTFEGEDVEWEVDDLVGDFFHPAVNDAIGEWRPLLAAPARPAREAYVWQRRAREAGVRDPRSTP